MESNDEAGDAQPPRNLPSTGIDPWERWPTLVQTLTRLMELLSSSPLGRTSSGSLTSEFVDSNSGPFDLLTRDIDEGDFMLDLIEILSDGADFDDEHYAAPLMNWARIFANRWRLSDPEAREALRLYAEERQISRQEAKRHLVIEAMIYLRGDANTQQTFRVGNLGLTGPNDEQLASREWLKTADGKQQQFVPAELSGGFGFELYTMWFLEKVPQKAEEILLAEYSAISKDRQREEARRHAARRRRERKKLSQRDDQELQQAEFEKEQLALQREVIALTRPDPEHDPVQELLDAEEGNALPTWLEKVSPRAQEFARLLSEGYSKEEILVIMNITSETYRVYRHQLRKAANPQVNDAD